MDAAREREIIRLMNVNSSTPSLQSFAVAKAPPLPPKDNISHIEHSDQIGA
jgi:hypothetical protein